MKLLIRAVRIVDKKSPFNGQVKDILIEGGKIKEIGKVSTLTGLK
jgi:dihydroorotase